MTWDKMISMKRLKLLYKKYFPDAPLPTIEEVTNEFKKLKSKKAPGIDGISNHTLKNIGLPTIVFFTTIISFMFKAGYFPRLWKITKVTPLLKPGKNVSHVISYRPISLLCELAKIIVRGLLWQDWKKSFLTKVSSPMNNLVSVRKLKRHTQYRTFTKTLKEPSKINKQHQSPF